ncbi:acyl-CoA N-acyltransferase [Infundibulicybe gibba]|nr:acyl-CoA N-acyltransferase [Infundibulicybe gibba]
MVALSRRMKSLSHPTQEIEQCYNMRIDVFHHEQGFLLELEIEALDEIATHFLLRLTPSLTPIGTIRAHRVDDGGYYKLSRLVVLKDYRNFRFGRKLVLALHDWVKEHALVHGTGGAGSVEIVAHSQIPAKGFYAKFGYEPRGHEFDEDGDPHQRMVLHLPL